jgi:hypothetical protein
MAREIREFTSLDWEAWSGAEAWPDGAKPLVAEFDEGVMLVDPEGAEFIFPKGQWDVTCLYLHEFETQQDARKFIEEYPNDVTAIYLESKGWK